jgi:hypothetical protein
VFRCGSSGDPISRPIEDHAFGENPGDPRSFEPGATGDIREFLMRDGDTLYVTSAPFTNWTKVLQSIAPFISFTGAARTVVGF